MGPYGTLGESGGAPDHVTRMKELLRRHRHVTWLRPGQVGVALPTATWLEVDADPRIDGTAVTVSRETLGMLVDYLEARLGR
jgi:hypothetical protein